MPASLPHLPPRKPDSNKGDFGRVLLIGGSRGMAGSISLSGMSALRSGAGLVRLAVPDVVQATVAGFEPSYMTVALPCDADGRMTCDAEQLLLDLAGEATVVGLGPGLGRSQDITQLVARLYCELSQPLVVDADGLNALAQQPDSIGDHAGPRVLTPHPGEFARLSGDEILPLAERESHAIALAAKTQTVILLKGHRTLITDGERSAHNETGNPGMATGGTGDVLTGIITALWGQGLSPFDAAQLGTHVHGLAGDLTAVELGQVSLIASDLLRFLPQAFLAVSGSDLVF